MTKVLLSFYTEGPPFDLGENLINQKDTFVEIGKKYFDEVIILWPRELIKIDPNWKTILYNESYFRKHLEASKKYIINLNWAKLNGLLWKPNLIKMVLNQDSIKNEDIVVYHDVNLFKYKVYKKN